MATQKSTSFGKLKRPAGKEFRSGTLGEALDDLYADIDDAFESIEKAAGYEPVRLATAATLGQHAVDYNVTKPADSTVLTKASNGALTIDGTAAANGDRVLVKDTHASSAEYKGIYTVTDKGAVGAPWILTRAADMNETDDVVLSRSVLITAGTANANTSWRVSTKPATLDTDDMAWTQIGGTGLDINGLAGAAIASDDSIAFEDNGDNVTKKATMTQLGAVLAGDGLTNTSGVLSVEAGTAADGIESGKLRYSAGEAIGAMSLSPGVPVYLSLVLGDVAGGDHDFTGLIGKHTLVDAWVNNTAGGHAANSYTVKTSGGTSVTDAMTPGATIDSVARAATIVSASATFNSGSDIRITVNDGGGSTAAIVHLLMVPVA